jgi:flagellar biosynthesis/type III secretory pathway chaperone
MEDIDRLCLLLDEETDVCGRLSTVLRDEQQAVVRLRPDDILTCLEQREELQGRLTALADERRRLVREVSARRGSETPQAVEMLPMLPIEPQHRVRRHLRKLRGALLETRGLERQTALLVGASLDGVQDMLRTLRAHVPGTTYGANATLDVPALPERVDRRA